MMKQHDEGRYVNMMNMMSCKINKLIDTNCDLEPSVMPLKLAKRMWGVVCGSAGQASVG